LALFKKKTERAYKIESRRKAGRENGIGNGQIQGRRGVDCNLPFWEKRKLFFYHQLFKNAWLGRKCFIIIEVQ
jgi:hypothetical protein